eukprot:GHVO01052840.1.p1 GENE.GHVO01052840.1~~GHVO01052840.1.p1  ORF type:complete len:107 (+),score=7.53 GHVO01052840.1:240-560(+)
MGSKRGRQQAAERALKAARLFGGEKRHPPKRRSISRMCDVRPLPFCAVETLPDELQLIICGFLDFKTLLATKAAATGLTAAARSVEAQRLRRPRVYDRVWAPRGSR